MFNKVLMKQSNLDQFHQRELIHSVIYRSYLQNPHATVRRIIME